MIDEKIKKMYDWVLENIALKEINLKNCASPHSIYRLKFLDRAKKISIFNVAFPWELTKEATEQDYIDYVKYVIKLVNMTMEQLETKIKF